MTRTAMIAGAAWLFAAQLAAAQSGAPAPPAGSASAPETVIVTARRPQEDINTIVSRFVDLHAATDRKTGQYMRDDVGPVCPLVLGLPQAFDDFVARRIMGVAASVGARAASGAQCAPNVEVLFTAQPQAAIDALAERTDGAILGVHYVHETPQLLKITHPIQGWYITGTRTADNSSSPVTSESAGGLVQAGNDKSVVVDNAYANAAARATTGSRLPAQRVSSILNVVIVADTRVVAGRQIGPVADYIAMLALSEPRSLDQCNVLPSILDLMSVACGSRPRPGQLTGSDIAYLKGLYAADLGASTNSMQKQSIQRGMESALGAGSAPR